MKTVYIPRIQPDYVECGLFALHAAASLAALGLFIVAVLAWAIGLGA
jgi:hypothetical protein